MADRTVGVGSDVPGLIPPSARRSRRPWIAGLAVAAFAVSSHCSPIYSDEFYQSGPIRYFTDSRTEPRPLVIHRLTIDLQAPEFFADTRQFEFAFAVGDDPDGDGPIEASLTPPSQLAMQERMLAAVNTNAWAMLPKPTPGKGNGYVAGGTVNISGWVRTNGQDRSPQQAGHWSLWIDGSDKVHVGESSTSKDVRCAISGFSGLLRDGRILPEPSEVLHPRTAAGIDRDGRHLVLLVVDGRRKGYSEGVSERELAILMIESGCSDALNLDGGGSTVMLLGEDPTSLKTMNRPSDPFGPRPVPVMLGIRKAL